MAPMPAAVVTAGDRRFFSGDAAGGRRRRQAAGTRRGSRERRQGLRLLERMRPQHVACSGLGSCRLSQLRVGCQAKPDHSWDFFVSLSLLRRLWRQDLVSRRLCCSSCDAGCRWPALLHPVPSPCFWCWRLHGARRRFDCCPGKFCWFWAAGLAHASELPSHSAAACSVDADPFFLPFSHLLLLWRWASPHRFLSPGCCPGVLHSPADTVDRLFGFRQSAVCVNKRAD
ncbi:unnamed protein product, partial [Phaeothamnion confervicola]